MVSAVKECFSFSWLFEIKIDVKESQLSLLANQWLKTENLLEKRELKQKFEALRVEIVSDAFELKKKDCNYKMSSTAQKVYDTALKITEGKFHGSILDHGEEYAFLTNDRHYLHKHIETLEKWNQGTAKVKINHQGELTLRTYRETSGARLTKYHKVTDLMSRSEKNPDLVLDYDYFSIKVKPESSTELEPAFKVKGDGRYHVSVVTDCPSKKMEMEGQHAWLRLIDPDGRVYSVGKFPKVLRMPYVYAKDEVKYSSSDNHEWLCKKDSIYENSFTITESDFEILKKSIIEDMTENKEDRDFNLFQENCADWTIEKLSLIGLHIEKSEIRVDQFNLLVPSLSENYDDYAPPPLKKRIDPLKQLASFVAFQIFRFVMVVFFGGLNKNKGNKGSRCFMSSPKKVFDPKLTHLTHPWRLNKFLQKNRESIQAIYDKSLMTDVPQPVRRIGRVAA